MSFDFITFLRDKTGFGSADYALDVRAVQNIGGSSYVTINGQPVATGSGITGPAGPTGPQGTSINVRGSVANVGDLPLVGNQVNDAYIVDSDGDLYIWDGSSWFSAGQIVGPQGLQGPAGPTGATGADALWNFLGEYNGGADYAIGDIVTLGGSCWYSLTTGAGVGHVPGPGSTYWTVIASAGSQGETGPAGPTGPGNTTGLAIGTMVYADGSGGIAGDPLFNFNSTVSLTIDGSVLPDPGGSYDLGSNMLIWNNSWVNNSTVLLSLVLGPGTGTPCTITDNDGQIGTAGQSLGTDGTKVVWSSPLNDFSGPTGAVLWYDGSGITGNTGLSWSETAGMGNAYRLSGGPNGNFIDLDQNGYMGMFIGQTDVGNAINLGAASATIGIVDRITGDNPQDSFIQLSSDTLTINVALSQGTSGQVLTSDGQYATWQTVPAPPVYQATFSKSALQNLTSPETDITFDVTEAWSNAGTYITQTSPTDFTVGITGLYQLEFNANIIAVGTGTTWTSVNKTISLDITRSPEAEVIAIQQSASISSGANYSQSLCCTFRLLPNDVINCRISNNFSGGPPYARGVTNTFDLNTFFTWRFIS